MLSRFYLGRALTAASVSWNRLETVRLMPGALWGAKSFISEESKRFGRRLLDVSRVKLHAKGGG